MAALEAVAQAALQRGLAERRAGRQPVAQGWFQLAACAAPADTRVVTLVIAGDAAVQARWCRRVLCLDPCLAQVQELGGRAMAETGDGVRAIAMLRRAVLLAPGQSAEAAFALSDVFAKAGRAASAYPLAWLPAQAAPGNPAVQVRLAGLAGQTGRHRIAAHAYIAAALLLPTVTDLTVSAVLTARMVGLDAEVWPLACRATLLDPGAGDAAVLMAAGKARPPARGDAATWARRASRARPISALVWDAVARTACGAGDFAASLRAARRGLLVNPGDVGSARSLAQAAVTLARFELAGRVARTALTAQPGDAELTYHLAQVEKSAGDLARGWALDARRTSGPRFHRTKDLPPPAGVGPLPRAGLLVAAEQGIGDELLFLSCLPDLLAECPEAVVEADPRFYPLLARSFPGLRMIDRQVRQDGEKAIYDYADVVPALGLTSHIHAGDLPGRYRADRDRPCERAAYLRADPERIAHWRARLAAIPGDGLTVGICWRSMLASGVRSLYYAEPADLLPLFRLPGLRFVCLQYDECRAELDALRRDHGVEVWRPEDLDQMEDLDGVAALISALDVVVSTATSVCVLAAALGRPTIRLAPSFYSILDDRDFFFPTLVPTIRRHETIDLSLAIGRAMDILVTRSKPANTAL